MRDINIAIHRGQTVGLAGANGSGKSTTLKVLAGILRPTSGKVEVNGRIASLLEVLKEARSTKKQLVLFGLTAAVRQVLQLTRLTGVFEIRETEAEALDA